MNNKSNNQSVTKADFQILLTTLKKFATNKDLKKTEKNLRVEILKVEERVENLEVGQKRIEAKVEGIEIKADGIEKGQESLSEKFDNLYNIVLEFLGRTETLEKENIVGVKHYRDHEKRISKLESRTQAA